jgi:hypothetical protein
MNFKQYREQFTDYSAKEMSEVLGIETARYSDIEEYVINPEAKVIGPSYDEIELAAKKLHLKKNLVIEMFRKAKPAPKPKKLKEKTQEEKDKEAQKTSAVIQGNHNHGNQQPAGAS